MPVSSALGAALATPRTRPASAALVAPAPAVDGELRELLVWVARAERRYADAMEVWQTACPRHSIWEDALAANLVQLERGAGSTHGESRVRLTARGCAALA